MRVISEIPYLLSTIVGSVLLAAFIVLMSVQNPLLFENLAANLIF